MQQLGRTSVCVAYFIPQYSRCLNASLCQEMLQNGDVVTIQNGDVMMLRYGMGWERE